jgi:hypothetical protein
MVGIPGSADAVRVRLVRLRPARTCGTTSITVTHYGAVLGSAVYFPLDTFVMRKSLRDGHGHSRGHRDAGVTATR